MRLMGKPGEESMDKVHSVETALLFDEMLHDSELDIDYVFSPDEKYCQFYTFVDSVKHALEVELEGKHTGDICREIQTLREYINGEKESDDSESVDFLEEDALNTA